jgi:hypothetical protein
MNNEPGDLVNWYQKHYAATLRREHPVRFFWRRLSSAVINRMRAAWRRARWALRKLASRDKI